MPKTYGSTAEFKRSSLAFCKSKPPQSKRDGKGGAPEADPSMVSQSFSGWLNRL